MTDGDLRARLIHEATYLFAKRGFGRASVREIVEAAGATKPTLYYYFGSKAGLFQAVVDHHLGLWVEKITETLTTDGPAIDRLTRWFGQALETCGENRAVMLFFMRAHLESMDGSVPIDFRAYREREIETICSVVREGIERGELRKHDIKDSVYALMGMLHVRMMEVLEGKPCAPDAAERMLRIYLKGVGA